MVSIRTPRAGRDLRCYTRCKVHKSFYPHAPGGARRIHRNRFDNHHFGFYPHAPGGARRGLSIYPIGLVTVSIRTPRAGRDMALSIDRRPSTVFLSARPGRGATTCAGSVLICTYCFYPHAPGGARPLFEHCG